MHAYLLMSTLLAAGSGAAADVKPVSVRALLADGRALTAWVRYHHRELAAAGARVAQAQADVDQSGVLLPNPQLTTGAGNLALSPTNPRGLWPHQTMVANAGLSQTFEVAKRGPRVAQAAHHLASQREEFLDTLAEHVADARLALGRVAYLRAKLDLLTDSLDGARRSVELERARLAAGDISGNDLDRLQLDTLALESDTALARADYQQSLDACHVALAAPCAEDAVELAELDRALPPGEGAADTAVARRPDLQSLHHEQRSAESAAELERRKLLPDPTVGVSYTHSQFSISGDNPDTLWLSLSVPLPIFDLGQHSARREHSRAVELRETRGALEDQARQEAASLRARRDALEQTLHGLEADAVPRSAAILATTQKAFQRGQVSMTDFLLARRTHTALLVRVMDLHFEQFQTRNDLARTLGLDAQQARDWEMGS